MAVAAVAGRALAKRVRRDLDKSAEDSARLRAADDQGASQHPKPIKAPAAQDDEPSEEGNVTHGSPPDTTIDSVAPPEPESQAKQNREAPVEALPRTRRPPIARGGRPRTPIRPESIRPTRSIRSFPSAGPRAHLCVWQQRMGWRLGVEVQPKLEQDLSIRQGGVELEQDEFDPDRWLVRSDQGVIDVWHGEVSLRRIGELAQSSAYLVFRLVGADLDTGIFAKQPTAGEFLLLVPCDWAPPESESSEVVVDAGPVTPPTFRAYYVDIEPGTSATVRVGADPASASAIRFNDAGQRFSLTGTRIEDAAPRHGKRSARQGPLYGGRSTPMIVDGQGWGGVSTIIVGEEGGGKDRWREEIDRKTHHPSKRLRELLTERPAGWFFLRFYDEQDDLIDSLDFRYAAGLNAPPCLIEAGEPAPEREFDEVLIEHDSRVRVEAAGSDDLKLGSRPGADGGSVLRIPRSKNCDHTEWAVIDEDARVPLYVELPRFWWRLRNEEESEIGQWSSGVLDLQMNEFRATSPRVLDVSMPPNARDSGQVLIGFDSSSTRPCGASRSGDIAFPLRELESSASLRNAGRKVLRLYLPAGETIDLGALDLRARCVYCQAEASPDSVGQVEHLYERHFDDLFQELDYEETARLYPELKFPVAIYDCLQCDQFVPAGPGDPNPTTAIIRHCDDNHNGRRRFRPMKTSGEVRRHVLERLPHAYRCKVCKTTLKTEVDSVSQILKGHLRLHLSRLTTLD